MWASGTCSDGHVDDGAVAGCVVALGLAAGTQAAPISSCLMPLRGDEPADLYEIIRLRYETRSMIITSNRSAAEWPGVFGEMARGGSAWPISEWLSLGEP